MSSNRLGLKISQLAVALLGALLLTLVVKAGVASAQPTPDTNTLIAQCNQGSSAACVQAGEALARGPTSDAARGLSLFEKGCEANNARACALAANGHYLGIGTNTRDLFKAIDLGKKACDGNDKIGCFQLGTLYQGATGLPNFRQLASENFTKSCNLGHAPACAPAQRTPSQSARTGFDLGNPVGQRSDRNPTVAPNTGQPSQQTNPLYAGLLEQNRAAMMATATGQIVCTTRRFGSRQFSYTNSFQGQRDKLNEYKQSYARISQSLDTSLPFANMPQASAGETPRIDCSWYENEAAAQRFIEGEVAQARRDQWVVSRTFFRSN